MDEDPNPPSKPLKLRPSLKRASVNPLENLDVSNEPQNATLAPRRVSFAASAAIKPFAQDPEVNTIWDNSYETSIAHADSNVASLDMISNVQESNVVIVEREIVDRENIHVTRGTSKKRVIKDPLKPIEVNRTVYDKSCEMEMTCHGVQPEIFMPNNVTMYQDFEMSMTCNFRNEIFVAKENVVQPRRMNATQLNGTAMMDLTCPVPTATIMQSPEEDLEDDSSMEVTCNFSPNILVNKAPFTSALHLWEQQNSEESSMELMCKESVYDVENVKPKSGLSNKTFVEEDAPVQASGRSQRSILKGSGGARSSPVSSDSSMEMTCKYPGNKSIYDNVENIKPTSVLTNKTSQKSILKGSVGAKPSPLSSDSSMEMTGRLSENKPVYDNIENSNLAVNTRAQNRTVLETDNIYVDYSMERTYKLSQNETIEKQDKSLKGRNVTEQRKTENSCPGKAPAPALLENVEDMEMSFEVPKQRQPDKTLELSKFVALQTDPRKSTAIDKTWTFENNVLQSLQAEIKNSNVANVTLLEVTAPNGTKVSSPCGYNTMLALSLQEKTFDLIQTGQKLTQKEDSFSNILVEDLETQHCDFTLLPNISPEKVPSPSLVKYCQPRATSAMYSMNFSQFSNQLECSSSVVLPTIDDVLLAAFENPPELPEKIPLEPYEVLVQAALESLENLVCRIDALKSDQSLDPDSLRLPEEISDLTMRLSMNVTQASPDTSVTDRLDDSSQDSPERTSLHKQILKEFSCKDKDIIDLKRSEPNFYLFSLMCGSVLCSAELHPEDGFVMEFNKCSLLTGERDFFFHLNTLVVNRLMQKVEMSSLRSHLGRHFNMLTLLDFLYINAEKSVKFYGELMEIQRKYITFDIQTTETNESILSFNILVANPAIHWTVEFKMASEESLREGSLVATSKYGAINEEHLQSIFRNTEPGSMCVMRFIGTVEEYFRRSVLFKEVNKLKDDMDNYVRFKLLSERKRTSSDAPAAAELKKLKL